MSILRYFITSKAKRKLLRLFLEDTGTPYYTREVARVLEEPLNAVRRELGYMEKAGLLVSYKQGNQKYYRVMEDFPLLHEWRRIILETPDAVTKSIPSVIARSAATPPPAGGAQSPKTDPVIASGEAVRQSQTPEGEPAIASVASPPSVGAQSPKTDPVIASGEAARQSDELDHVIAPSPVIASGEAVRQSSPPETTPFTALKERLSALLGPQTGIAMALIHGPAALQEEIPTEGVDLLVVTDMEKDALIGMLSDIEEQPGARINLVRLTRSDFEYRNAKGDPFIRKIWSEKKLVVKGRH